MSAAQNWSRENLAWCGGLFEGEGCITFTKDSVKLILKMTDEDAVRRFADIIGLGRVRGPLTETSALSKKPFWEWNVSRGSECQAVLAALWAFLCSRRRARAEEMLRHISRMKTWNREKTVCAQGHPYTEENTFYRSNGTRWCRTCLKVSRAKWNQKKKKKNVHFDLYGTQISDSEQATPQ